MNSQDYSPITGNTAPPTRPRRTILITIITAVTTTILFLAVSNRTGLINASKPLTRWARSNTVAPALAPAAVPVIAPQVATSRNPLRCTCPRNYDPVCCYGRSFGYYTAPNECVCKCGIDTFVLYEGPCEENAPPPLESCICPLIFAPVCCSKDGDTTKVPNSCECRCGGGEVVPGSDC